MIRKFTPLLVCILLIIPIFSSTGAQNHNVNIIYDPRNKETHQKKHFREYLETRILGNALENEVDISLSITSEDSSKCYGLLAVDYFSWSIFRKFEYGDDSYFSLIQDKLKRRREWYI